MARDPNTPALAADYDALLAQLAAMRDEMTKLATQVSDQARQGGKAMADTINTGLHDARSYAGHKAHDADAKIEHAVAANPYVALGLAAGLGVLLGALTSALRQMGALLADLLAPLGNALRAGLQQALLGLLAALLAVTGGVFLLASACVALVPLLGVAGALAVTGLAFGLLAGAALLALPRPAVPPAPIPAPQPDPMVQLIFDLSFNLGRSLPRRKD